MAKQTVSVGTSANDGTGDALRTAFTKLNDNFTEVYNAIEVKGTDVVIVNPVDNSTDGSVTCCFIAGGEVGGPNIIGSTGKPAYTGHTPTGWSDDTGYVTGAAAVATIGGGYDHVNNQLAGTICGGGHNFIKSNVDGHGFIGGGSYNIIAGGRGVICGGRQNAIDSATAFGAIVGGDDNELLNGDYSFIGGGLSCQVSGAYSSIPVGRETVVSGASSISAGSFNTVANNNSAAFGSWAVSRATGTLTHANERLVEAGDAQSISWVANIRTTNATATNTTSQMQMPAGKVCAGTFKVLLIAMRDGSADGNNDANYAQSSYQLEGGFHWDGTNGLFYDASGTTTLGTSPTRNLTVIRDNITLGTAPQLRLNTGSLRVNVTGIAATTINWVVRFDMVMTLVS